MSVCWSLPAVVPLKDNAVLEIHPVPRESSQPFMKRTQKLSDSEK